MVRPPCRQYVLAPGVGDGRSFPIRRIAVVAVDFDFDCAEAAVAAASASAANAFLGSAAWSLTSLAYFPLLLLLLPLLLRKP